MLKFIKKRLRTVGLPPGSLVHLGETHKDAVEMVLTKYNAQSLESSPVQSVQEVKGSIEEDQVCWFHINGLHKPETIKEIGQHFDIHSLVLEDILNTGHRPKVENMDDILFTIIRSLSYDKDEDVIHSEQVSFIVKDNILITFTEQPNQFFDIVARRLQNRTSRLRKYGVGFLLYALLDAIIDSYFVILGKVGDRLEELEDESLLDVQEQTLQSIYHYKRELVTLRNAIRPVREMISTIQRSDKNIVEEETESFWRDLQDHTVQIIEVTDTFREMLMGIMDMYYSYISHRMNEVMKVLTIISTIFIPLSFLAGVYGMNFVYMPELQSPWGYPILILFMLVIAFCMLLFFRKKHWL